MGLIRDTAYSMGLSAGMALNCRMSVTGCGSKLKEGQTHKPDQTRGRLHSPSHPQQVQEISIQEVYIALRFHQTLY